MNRKIKYSVLIIAAILCCGSFLSASRAVVAESEGQRAGRKSAVKRVGAKELYAQNCARCHGADGRGETALGKALGAPDFTSAAWHEHASNGSLTASVTHGKGSMPAFARKLSKSEIASLVTYVRRLKS